MGIRLFLAASGNAFGATVVTAVTWRVFDRRTIAAATSSEPATVPVSG